MSLLAIMLVSAAALLVAYFTYGSLLSRLLKLDDTRVTPAVELRDDIDYQPIEPKFLIGQHFSAIAAAGPIVGPILAGVMFGWLPALVWIIVGSIFIGGVHDMTSLVASIRHKARSIAEVVKEHMSQRSYVLFLLFVWIALVYIIVAFTDIVASSFIKSFPVTINGVEKVIPAGSIATSSLLYLALPLIMGALLRFTKLGLGWATIIFLPLVGLSVWVGQFMPLDIATRLHLDQDQARRVWDVALLVYCFFASIAPVWLLLQPRGHLGGFFLVVAVIGGMLGAIIANPTIEYPRWIEPTVGGAANSPALLPMLFITIACGACSGFHCIIASGTTSKQIKRETDAKIIGYGTMLMEAMVAVLSLACVMILTQSQAAAQKGDPDALYARGLSTFLGAVGVPLSFGLLFGLLAFTTFVYDTLDVSTRLGRYIIQELTGMSGRAGRIIATALTVGVPLIFVLQHNVDATGKPVLAWRVFWNLFGASNQLLASLALLGVTVWLWRTRRAMWVWPVIGVPTVFMYAMSAWALIGFVRDGFTSKTTGTWAWTSNPVPYVALVLLGLAAMLLAEAVRAFVKPPSSSLRAAAMSA